MEKGISEKVYTPWRQQDSHPTLLLSTKRSIILSLVIAVVTTLLLSSQWSLFQHERNDSHSYKTYRLSAEDLNYGLSQCALNQQRPVVNRDLAATRLANRPGKGVRIILQNATLIDGDGEVTSNVTIEIQDGIFISVSTPSATDISVASAPSDEEVVTIDLQGRIVTPGLIDAHTHAGVRETPQLWATEDVTEISSPLTPWARAIDGFKPHDQAIAVIGSGGVTTSLVLTGAKSLISGEGLVIKMKQADSVRGLAVNVTEGSPKPQRYLKMATGENQKRQFEHVPGGPATRYGESFLFRKAYDNARRVKAEQDRWCEAAVTAAGRQTLAEEYPRSLEWQTLVDVLRGDLRVNVHGYETQDILAMLDHADEFGFNISALHHALHSDQVAAEIKQRGITIAGFSDSWGDKKELYNVSSYFPKRVAEQGIPFVLTRDAPAEHGQWLAYEAQIAHHFGLDERHAFSSVIAEPARLLGLDNRIGFVRPGYDADLVIWNRHPLRVGATPLEVYIDGKSTVRASDDLWEVSKTPSYASEGPSSRPDGVVHTTCKPGQTDFIVRGISKTFVGDDGIRSDEVQTGNLTAVVRAGKVVCIGGSKCEEEIKKAVNDDLPYIDVHDGHIIPGLTIVTRQHGLTEMRQEPSTTDGLSLGESHELPLYSRFGLKFDGVHIERTHRSGVTKLVTAPLTTGFFHGISALFRSGAKSVLEQGAVAKGEAALHFTIGHDGKNSRTPSITSQISTLHDLLTTSKNLHPIYARAAKGEIPVVVHTNNKDVIAHLVALKRETGARIVIIGGAEAHLVAPELAESDVPVIVAPFWGCEPLFFDSRHCLPGPPLVDRLGPQVLIDAGVKVGISNWDDTNNHVRNSAWEAGWLAGPGNRSLALDLVSKNIEDILQLPRTRDVVIYEGDPFEFGARVAVMLEEGQVHSCYPEVDEQ